AGHLTRTPVGWRLALAACADLPTGAVKALMRLALVEVAAADRLGRGPPAGHLGPPGGLPTPGAGARVRLPRGGGGERGRDALWVLRPATSAEPASLAIPGHTWAGDMIAVTAAIGAPRPGRPADLRWEAWFDADALGLRAGGAPPPGMLLVRPGQPGE